MQQLPNRITRLNNRNNRPYPVTGNMSPEDRAIAAQNLQNIWALQAQNNSTNNDNIGNLPVNFYFLYVICYRELVSPLHAKEHLFCFL